MDCVIDSFDILKKELRIHASTPLSIGIQCNFREVLAVRDIEGEVTITEEIFCTIKNGDILVCVDMNAGLMLLSEPFRVEYDPELLEYPVKITGIDYETGTITYNAREVCTLWFRRNGGMFDAQVETEVGKDKEVCRPVFRAKEHGGTVLSGDEIDCLASDGYTVLSEVFLADVPKTKALLAGVPETVRFLTLHGLNKVMTIKITNPEGSILLEEETLTRSNVELRFADGSFSVSYTGF
jgi:hypothetical protein